MIKDAYMKLSETFASHLSFMKELPISAICTKEYLAALDTILGDHVASVTSLLKLHQDKLEASAKIEKELDSLLKATEKPALRVTSESYVDPFVQTTKSLAPGMNGLAAKLPQPSLSLVSIDQALDPAAKFINNLLGDSDESDEERQKKISIIRGVNSSSDLESKRNAPAFSDTVPQSKYSQFGALKMNSTNNLGTFVVANPKLSTALSDGTRITFKTIEPIPEEVQPKDHEGSRSKRSAEDFSFEEEDLQNGLGNPLAEVNPKINVRTVQEMLIKGLDFYGSHTAVKIKRDMHFHGYLKKSRYIHSIIYNLDDPEKSTITKLDIESPVFNYMNFKGVLNVLFLENANIFVDFLTLFKDKKSGHQKSNTLCTKELYKTWYTVGNNTYPSTGRAICIGNNKLYYINQLGETVALDLQYFATNGPSVVGKEKSLLVHSGPTIDLSFTRKHLLVLCENGILEKIIPNDVSCSSSKPVKPTIRSSQVNLNELITDRAADAQYLVVASSLYEVVLTTYSYSQALTKFYHLRSSDLAPLQFLELPQQPLHVHQMKLLIRKKTSYYFALSRFYYAHIFAIGRNGMVMLQPNVSIYCGPIDGACVMNENEIVVFEGTKNLLSRILIH